jgi:hypothetical protein
MLKDYSITSGAKIHLIVKKDDESEFNKELRKFSSEYVKDTDEFVTVFNKVSILRFCLYIAIVKVFLLRLDLIKEMRKAVNEMSLDDLERLAPVNFL